MAKVTKICRICKKKYKACQTSAITNTFRWQDVACSPECGLKYLNKVRVARREIDENDETISTDVIYNEDFYGFDGEPEEEYISEFGSDE